MPYKKEVKLQHLTVVQHQKVYDTQRSKMKHMHVNCVMNIILKKKKKRTDCATPKVYSAARSSIKNENKKKDIFFFKKEMDELCNTKRCIMHNGLRY